MGCGFQFKVPKVMVPIKDLKCGFDYDCSFDHDLINHSNAKI